MTDAHTPGPWVELETESSVDLEDCEGWQDIGTADGRVMAIAVGYARFPSDDAEHTANARLIAAAPDLLEALRRCLPYIRYQDDEGPADEGWQSARLSRLIADADAAVAKATSTEQGERG